MTDEAGADEAINQPHARGPVAVVYNPTKIGRHRNFHSNIAAVADQYGWPEPTWYETTPNDAGLGQTRQALADGATLVCSYGGDGTVRHVASGLVDIGVPLGIIPGGTGNLLARNLAIPIQNITKSFENILTGTNSAIDAGLVRFDEGPVEYFFVAAGMGLDADIVTGADDTLKRTVGWFAYIESGMRAIAKSGFSSWLRAAQERGHARYTRSVMVGNCGTLQGGVQLFPDAAIDDGVLDAVMIAPSGIAGWGAAAMDIITRHSRGHRRLQRFASNTFAVRTDTPVPTQIDGDDTGIKQLMECGIKPGALIVRGAHHHADRTSMLDHMLLPLNPLGIGHPRPPANATHRPHP